MSVSQTYPSSFQSLTHSSGDIPVASLTPAAIDSWILFTRAGSLIPGKTGVWMVALGGACRGGCSGADWLGRTRLRVLYDYAWFVGFAVAFVLYWLLMRGTPQVDLDAV